MASILWVLAAVAAALSTLGATLLVLSAVLAPVGMSAPQQAAAAGVLLAFAIPPYLLARAVSYRPPWSVRRD